MHHRRRNYDEVDRHIIRSIKKKYHVSDPKSILETFRDHGLVFTSKRWLSVEEAAEYLGISPKTLYNWIYEQRCPFRARKLGRLTRFDREEIDQYLESL